MADVLDINTDAGDFAVGDEGDQSSVFLLKKKVLHRKGRGFKEDNPNERDEEDTTELVDGVPLKSAEGWILFIASVHEEASEEDLTEKFSEFGHINNVTVNLDRRTGFLKGYAMIEFQNFEAAYAAREALDGSEILGQEIRVNWCFVKAAKKTKRNKRKKH